jgi:hypothetical protein
MALILVAGIRLRQARERGPAQPASLTKFSQLVLPFAGADV